MTKSKNISFRMLPNKEARRAYKALMKANRLESVVRALAYEQIPDIGPIFRYTNNEKRVSFCIYRLTANNFGGKAVVKAKVVGWASYNKQTKTYREEGMKDLMKYVTAYKRVFSKISPIFESGSRLLECATKPVRKNLLLGKYTNERQLTKAILHARGLRRVGFFREWAEWLDTMSLYILRNCQPTQVHPGSITKFKSDYLFMDLVKMSSRLGKKVNLNWSTVRIKDEHDKLVRELAGYALLGLGDESIGYKDIPEHPHLTLLETNKDFYIEGQLMQHCVYSANYFRDACNRRCFILKYEKDGVRATAEVTLNVRVKPEGEHQYYIAEVGVRQLQGYRNSQLPDHQSHYAYILTELNKPEWRTFFINEVRHGRYEGVSPYTQEIIDALPF